MQNAAKLTEGRISLAAGTLYGAITTMVKKEFIAELPGEKNSRKKEYVIAEDGKRAVRNEMVRLEELLKNGELIYGGEQI